jgi:hypothetical protein
MNAGLAMFKHLTFVPRFSAGTKAPAATTVKRRAAIDLSDNHMVDGWISDYISAT